MADRLPAHPTTEAPRREFLFHEHQLPPIRHNASPEVYSDVDRYPMHSDSRLTHLYLPNQSSSVSSLDSTSITGEISRSYPPEYQARYGEGFGSSMLSNPKRAYRQRRKDPSCDACRERKVKCDATETASCTECSGRNVRCQFTKDSNRRMSSMKQVQDLERQLQEVKAQLELARSSEYATDQYAQQSGPTERSIEVPDINRSPQRRPRVQLSPMTSTSHFNLMSVGRGLFQPPVTSSLSSQPDEQALPSASLPAHDVAQACLDAYLESYHRRFPILFWPQFCRDFWDLYSRDLSLKVLRETVALSFAVLALGAACVQNHGVKNLSESFLTTAFSHIDMWTDRIGISQGLTSFLFSVYMYEANSKSSGWVWLASAIRVAQDRGFHIQGGSWHPIEGEMRKRIWYSLYVWDRVMSSEMGRPMMISDDDFDTEHPEDFDEDADSMREWSHPTKLTCFSICIRVTRLMQPVTNAGRRLCIATSLLTRLESRLRECASYFPPQLLILSSDPLDPAWLFPLICLQNAKLLLHRYNLSPHCSPEQRVVAIDSCARTAQDTANIISRCFTSGNDQEELEARIKSTATASTCMHLWRCMLFLAFRSLWPDFARLLHFATLIGDEKVINPNCGRYIFRFLQMLISRQQASAASEANESDEEIIVFLSGDLQNSANSWAWFIRETDANPDQEGRQGVRRPGKTTTAESGSWKEKLSWDSPLTEEEKQGWGGWSEVREAAQHLDRLQREPEAQLQRFRSSEIKSPLASRPRDRRSPESEPPSSSAKSKMAIASIT